MASCLYVRDPIELRLAHYSAISVLMIASYGLLEHFYEIRIVRLLNLQIYEAFLTASRFDAAEKDDQW